ncbi:MAG: plastocyanin/azurin family copper-binding protein [Solirubrobacterales bacterium]|nr:plastocyanin/azurin family copper-binding protein [Solirubrobacterales bacterium]
MKTTLIKRMQGMWVALVVVLIAGAIGTTAASAASEGASSSATATTSALTKKQKKAKAKALKKCKKQRNAKKRKACIKKVNKKYAKLARTKPKPPSGKTVEVDVMDDYYAPSLVNLKAYDWIKWDWKFSTSPEGHNVSLMSGPAGVSPFDYESSVMSGPGGTFKRQFKTPGTYNLFCSLHAGMTMDVQVSK